MDNPVVAAALVSGTFLLLVSIVGVIANWARSRHPEPPTTQEVWNRMDQIERKNAALVRVLWHLAEQWPEGAPAPTFESDDLKELADTMPPPWRRHPRPKPRRT